MKHTMDHRDLAGFEIDCSRKEEQIRFLQSLRSSRDDEFWHRLARTVRPWEALTNSEQHRQNNQVGSGRTNWLINQNIMMIQRNCG